MKKSLYMLLMLLVGFTTMGVAQEEASSITEWNGQNKQLRMKADSLITFSYKATANGTLYIYSDNQAVTDNVHVSIWGGWYHDGAYDADSPLQEAGSYENGVGIYAWIKVFAGDEIRFTLSTPEEAEGIMAILTLKSLFFSDDVKGNTWEQPITLTQNTQTALPVYQNFDSDYLGELSYATFCRFVAPSDGVASIFTSQYLIYYIEEELYGSTDHPLRYATQDMTTDDHEFVVEKDKAYIVIVPNSRPTNVTFKMISNRLGENCKAPIELKEFPAVLDLVKGNNFYRIDLSSIGDKYIMELGTAANWKGTITYLDNCDYESEELLPATINGTAMSYIHNLDPLFMNGELIINFNVTDVASADDAATITLREAKEGESFDKAMPIAIGENTFSGAARDYWFVYTTAKDAEISVATTGTLKHILYSRGSGNIINEYNVYRVDEGQAVYICVSTTTEGAGTITLTEKAIEAGDYCDMPITFSLGEDIVIKDRGDNKPNFRLFTAEESGFAILTTTSKVVLENYWSVYFRGECGGKTLQYETSETTDSKGTVTSRSYKLPISAGNSYIVDISSYENGGADIIFKTAFEAANQGEVCATAVEIETLGDTIDLAYEFNATKWYKFTANQTGFYTVAAKLGYAANMKTKVGDCDAKETNANNDNSKNNAYMGGYEVARVYVEEGQTLYIYTKTGSENDSEQFGDYFYLVAAYDGAARPGEVAVVAVKAEANTEYTVLQNDENGYEQWYTYTIPAKKATTIVLHYTAKTKYITNNLSLYKEDMTTSMSRWNGDFTQTDLTNDTGEIYGKRMEITAADEARTIYIKVSTANANFYPEPVVWKIEGDGADIEDIAAPQTESTVIYDLMGRRVASPSKGIYIINGKKVVIK